MSGHNKWAQIKRQKGKTDAAKSKIFGKLAKSITEEARKAKGNLTAPGLKLAIEKAKAENMPNDNIDRAIKRAAGNEGEAMERIVYEAYGPGGSALIIEALTGNRNKAAQEVKFALSKHGFALGAIGSVTWAFEKTNEGWVPTSSIELSEADLKILSDLIEELESSDEVHEIYTNAE